MWPKQYTAKGQIILPYGDITEPFTAYIDMSGKGRSRIDYYGGNLSCMQLNKHGHSALLIVKTVHNDIVFDFTLKSTTTHVYKS